MPKKAANKERYNFLIDKDIYNDFSAICDELGLVRSKKVEHYMKEFIEENKKTLDEIKSKKK